MGYYTGVIKKELRPYIQGAIDDYKARRDLDFFWPNGTQIYCGKQGSGKTLSAVKHVLRLKARYPKLKVVTNLDLRVRFDYIKFQTAEELADVLVKVNNGKFGVVYLIDEVHTYFNSLDSKNIPMFIFTEISQQRKQRKCIVGTSQLFMRLAKPFREQCDNIIICNTLWGFITFQKAYDGMTIEQDFDGSISGTLKKSGLFFHTRRIRNAYDTYQKVISAQEQYEMPQKVQMSFDNKTAKAMKR